jgi:undecaprenyl diphosphate synthase
MPRSHDVRPPNHIAIIPDGNQRWARRNRIPLFSAYRLAIDRGTELVRAAHSLGIHTVTFWGLSTENWSQRPAREVAFLFGLMSSLFQRFQAEAHEQQVRLVHLGRRDHLPPRVLQALEAAQRETQDYTTHTLNLAVDYGGRDEIARAFLRLRSSDRISDMGPEELTNALGAHLDTAGQRYPEPDLIIRTGGEMRLSGFLPWQSVYTELLFRKELFPDYTVAALTEDIESYGLRTRRFGGH